MKKTIASLLVFILLFASGCSKEETLPPIDASIWGYDYNANQVNGSFAAMRTVTEGEQGIFFQINIDNSLERNVVPILGYVDKETGQFSVVDSTGSAQCSVDSPGGCSSLLEFNYNFMNYYNGHLYFVDTVIEDSGKYSQNLVEMDLDGNNRKNVVHLKDFTASGESSFTMLFHRGFIYFSYNDHKISKVDMTTWEVTDFVVFTNSTKLSVISATGDMIIFTSSVYIDGEQKISDALLSVDTKGENVSLLEREMPVYQVRDNLYIYFNKEQNSMDYFNSKTEETRELKKDTGSVIFMEDGFVIKDLSDDPIDLLLYDLDGNLLDTFSQDNRMEDFSQVMCNNYFYTYIYYSDRTEFVRIPIQDKKFGEMEIIAEWKGSPYGS